MIAKPHTMMNRSGAAAARLSDVSAPPSEIIVAYDDVALPLGAIRVRRLGRRPGQKGMESILQRAGDRRRAPRADGDPGVIVADADLADYVLEPFLPGERETAEAMVDRAAEAHPVPRREWNRP